MVRECNWCGKLFDEKTWYEDDARHPFCSREHKDASVANEVGLQQCPFCGRNGYMDCSGPCAQVRCECGACGPDVVTSDMTASARRRAAADAWNKARRP